MANLFGSNIFERDEGLHKTQVTIGLCPANVIRGDSSDGIVITGGYAISHADSSNAFIPLDLPDGVNIDNAIIYGSHYLETKFGLGRTAVTGIGVSNLITPGLINVERAVEQLSFVDNINYNYYIYFEDFNDLNYIFGGKLTYTEGGI